MGRRREVRQVSQPEVASEGLLASRSLSTFAAIAARSWAPKPSSPSASLLIGGETETWFPWSRRMALNRPKSRSSVSRRRSLSVRSPGASPARKQTIPLRVRWRRSNSTRGGLRQRTSVPNGDRGHCGVVGEIDPKATVAVPAGPCPKVALVVERNLLPRCTWPPAPRPRERSDPLAGSPGTHIAPFDACSAHASADHVRHSEANGIPTTPNPGDEEHITWRSTVTGDLQNAAPHSDGREIHGRMGSPIRYRG